MSVHVDNSGPPGIVRISSDPAFPRPHVGVVGSVHGNEPCGRDAIASLRSSLERGHLALRAGTITLVHANPKATELGVRHTEDGADLNRILDFAYVDTLDKRAWGYEHHRALELRLVLEDLDALLDIHSSGSPTPPFAITNAIAPCGQWASALDVPFVIDAWDTLADKITTGVLERRGKPALGVECGAHNDSATSDNARSLATQFLVVAGVLEGDASPRVTAPKRVFVRETITKPNAEFKFARPIAGFDKLEANTLIGRDGLIEIRTALDCYAVLPNDNVPVGKDVLYLAVEA